MRLVQALVAAIFGLGAAAADRVVTNFDFDVRALPPPAPTAGPTLASSRGGAELGRLRLRWLAGCGCG